MTLLTSGWYGRPLSRRVRLRRSTVLLLVSFVLLGLLYLQVGPPGDPASSGARPPAVHLAQPSPATTARPRTDDATRRAHPSRVDRPRTVAGAARRAGLPRASIGRQVPSAG